MKRQGAVLVEVLAAFVILSLAGISTLEFLTSLADAQRRVDERELEMRRAERLLLATTLLDEGELGQRLGVRRAEDFLVWVGRPEPFLFRVGISSAARPEAELLATLVHRRSAEAPDEP